MIRLLLTLFLVLSASPAFTQTELPEAPFGLKWGASTDEIKAMGVTLSNEVEGNYGRQAEAKKLPKVVNDAERVTLYFGHNNKLYRIVANSNEFENDKSGYKAQARYNELKSALEERYGKGKETAFGGGSEFMRKRENFAYSLKAGDRFHYSNWDAKGLGIELSVRALDMNNTYWVLIYYVKELEKAFEASKKRKEKEAL